MKEKLKKENENNIPEPTVKEVEKYLKKWEGLENYVLQEKSLNKLFHKKRPKIWVKFYKARIFLYL